MKKFSNNKTKIKINWGKKQKTKSPTNKLTVPKTWSYFRSFRYLIPLGSGLAALGFGDINTLAEALTIAFDTTVTGLLIGALGYLSI